MGTPDRCLSAYQRILILSRVRRRRARIDYRGAARRVAMEVVHPLVAGIDVHKKVIWVAVRLTR